MKVSGVGGGREREIRLEVFCLSLNEEQEKFDNLL